MKTGWQLIFIFWSKRKCTYCCKQVERMYTNREIVENRGSRNESRKDQVSQDMTVSDVIWRHGLNRFHLLRHLQMTHTAPYWRAKFCISIVFNFSWDGCNTQEKWETKVMKNSGLEIHCIMGEVQEANARKSAKPCYQMTKISIWISIIYTHVRQVVSLISIGNLKGIFQVT